MGFLRRLFSSNKKHENKSSSVSKTKEKRRWSFVRSSNTTTNTTTDSPNSSSLFSNTNKYTNTTSSSSPYEDGLDANKHAIAVAAATAAVAEAALAAAQAAAEVVRLTTSTTAAVRCSNYNARWRQAALLIQSTFRGYLARRALRALKALVKLQAHVRGHIVRKQTADMLRRMQTLVRVQARARATRSHVSKSFHSISQLENSQNYRCGSNSNFRDAVDLDRNQQGSNWLNLNRWMEDSLWNNKREPSMRHRHADDERNDKILEVDTWKPQLNPQHNNRSFRTTHNVFSSDYGQSPMSITSSPSKKSRNPIPSEVSSPSSVRASMRKEESASRTTQNSPRLLLSASSRPGSSNARRGPFTPTGSECSWGYFGGYAGHPNYMANTHSFKAKVRSQSAPRQRLELESYGSNRRTLQGFLDTSVNSEKGYGQYGESRNYGYPVSSYLDRLGSSNVRR